MQNRLVVEQIGGCLGRCVEYDRQIKKEHDETSQGDRYVHCLHGVDTFMSIQEWKLECTEIKENFWGDRNVLKLNCATLEIQSTEMYIYTW